MPPTPQYAGPGARKADSCYTQWRNTGRKRGVPAGLFREASEGRAPPKPALEVPRILRNTPLTCNALGRTGWRKMVEGVDLATSCKPRNRERRKDAHAATGAVNTTGAVVNCCPAMGSAAERES